MVILNQYEFRTTGVARINRRNVAGEGHTSTNMAVDFGPKDGDQC